MSNVTAALEPTVTPDELRTLGVRESVRGFHRGDVRALCERAAATIELLERRHRALAERVERAPGPRSAMDADPDVIQRTLILAQRAADEALAEAEATAAARVGEAEARAERLVTEAEETARRVSEAEQARMQGEIARFAEAREALAADVDALERFATGYRRWIRDAIEAELERIGVAIVDPPGSGVGSAVSGVLELTAERGAR